MSKSDGTNTTTAGGGGGGGGGGMNQQKDEEFELFTKDEPELASKCQQYDRYRGSYSPLQKERLNANCKDYLPGALRVSSSSSSSSSTTNSEVIAVTEEESYKPSLLDERIKSIFPNTLDMKPLTFVRKERNVDVDGPYKEPEPVRVGVVLSGGQAPGGHNVICGIFDRVRTYHPKSHIFGFIDGPHGIFSGNFYYLTSNIINSFRNTGGFDMLGSGRHKIESNEQFDSSLNTCDKVLNLDGLVVIGGDDSNTNAAVLGEYFKSQGSKTKVVGCPKTIDGDLKVMPYIPVSFGFDTACRTYSELVGNCCVDSLSAQKYYHFIRLMGRSASNIALECALQTLPNYCFVGEEVKSKKWGLRDLTNQLCDMIQTRYDKQKKKYGVVLLPEGLIEFIPEFECLIQELNELGESLGDNACPQDVRDKLQNEHNIELFDYLPSFLQQQLLLDRDPHGNVQVAKIETEKLLAATVKTELKSRFEQSCTTTTTTTPADDADDDVEDVNELVDLVFQPQFHAFGYEGRAGLPTLFDSAYCYALGSTASQLILSNKTGLIASVTGLQHSSPSKWSCGGVPVTSLCVIERRKGKDKAVIRKALIDLPGTTENYNEYNKSPFYCWNLLRDILQEYDLYRIPGPTQFDKQSLDIPVMLRIELQGCVKLLSELTRTIIYNANKTKEEGEFYNNLISCTTNEKEIIVGGEEEEEKEEKEEKAKAYLNKLIEKSKLYLSDAICEKRFIINWPLKNEEFIFTNGSRPKSTLQSLRIKQGYDIPMLSFGIQSSKPDSSSNKQKQKQKQEQQEEEEEESKSSSSSSSPSSSTVNSNCFFDPIDCEDVTCIQDEITQCLVSEDEDYLKRSFPHTYGRRLVEITKPGMKNKKKDDDDDDNTSSSSRILYRMISTPNVSSTTTTTGAQAKGDDSDSGGGGGGAIGIVFCGRQTPGGHDAIAGLWDICNGSSSTTTTKKTKTNTKTKTKKRIVGFIGGSRGFFSEQYIELTHDKINNDVRHSGGYDLFGRTKDQFYQSKNDGKRIIDIMLKHDITSLVLVGGTRTCTSACKLAEYLEHWNKEQQAQAQAATKAETEAETEAPPPPPPILKVVAIPLSQGGSFTNAFIEQSLGFDSTSKATARLAGNTEIDGSSARKYYYFLRTMEGGDTAAYTSHLTLEVGLQSKPNYILLSEEILDNKKSLQDVVNDIANVIQTRWENGKKNFGTIIVPDNLAAVIPELRVLLSELIHTNQIITNLSPYSQALLKSLPQFVIDEVTKKTNKIDLQQIPTERMLADLVGEELKKRDNYNGKFSAVCQFLGYQTRGSLPSIFDSNYGYALGGGAAVLLRENYNGYMVSLANLKKGSSKTTTTTTTTPTFLSSTVFGVPLTAMLEVKTDSNEHLPIARIYPKPVDLKGKAYMEWKRLQNLLINEERYENPGPIQFHGACATLLTKHITSSSSISTSTSSEDDAEYSASSSYLEELAILRENTSLLLAKLRPGVSNKKLRIANSSLKTLRNVLEEL